MLLSHRQLAREGLREMALDDLKMAVQAQLKNVASAQGWTTQAQIIFLGHQISDQEFLKTISIQKPDDISKMIDFLAETNGLEEAMIALKAIIEPNVQTHEAMTLAFAEFENESLIDGKIYYGEVELFSKESPDEPQETIRVFTASDLTLEHEESVEALQEAVFNRLAQHGVTSPMEMKFIKEFSLPSLIEELKNSMAQEQ